MNYLKPCILNQHPVCHVLCFVPHIFHEKGSRSPCNTDQNRCLEHGWMVVHFIILSLITKETVLRYNKYKLQKKVQF